MMSGGLVVVFRIRMWVNPHPEESFHRGLQGSHFFFQVADPLAKFAVVLFNALAKFAVIVIDTLAQFSVVVIDTFIQTLHQCEHQAAQGDADCDNCDDVRCHRGTIGQ